MALKMLRFHMIPIVTRSIAALIAATTSSLAYPTYNRLGYISCQTCHYNVQGAGMLNPTGKTLQGAFSFFESNTRPEIRKFSVGLQSRLLYISPLPFLMQADAMGAAQLGEHLQVETQLGLGLRRESGKVVSIYPGANAFVVRRFIASYTLSSIQPIHQAIALGRDSLPGGLMIDDHFSFLRSRTRRNVTDLPTQFRYELGVQDWNLIAFGFVPSFEELPDNQESGGGARVEYALSPANSLGASLMLGASPSIRRFAVSVFARLSPHSAWGLLSEFVFQNRTLLQSGNTQVGQTILYLKPYWSPAQWTEAGLAMEAVHTGIPFQESSWRVGPSLNLRLLHWVSVLADFRITVTHAVLDSLFYTQVYFHL